MRNNIVKGMMLAAFTFSCTAVVASVVRAPLVTERGSLRYDMEKKKDTWSLNLWSTGHYREAHKSYLKHGFDTKSLPAVIFGKEEFTLAEAFQDARVNHAYFENRNPFLAITKFAPVASYTERGMSVGGRFEYPVWNNKGRVGLRGVVPFRSVRVEREDEGENRVDGTNRSIVRGDSTIIKGGALGGTPHLFENISRYKLSLLSGMLRLVPNGTVLPALNLTVNPNPSGIYGAQYNKTDAAVNDPANVARYADSSLPFVVIRDATGAGPIGVPTAVVTDRLIAVAGNDVTDNAVVAATFEDANNNRSIRFGSGIFTTDANLVALPTTGLTGLDATKGYAFIQSNDYTNLVNQPGFDQLWVTPVFQGNALVPTAEAQSRINSIEAELKFFQLGVEEWLKQKGNFEFATNQHTGLGDIDLDAFYEHMLNDDWRAELMLGVRFPTGGTSKFCANPYRISQGNGNHFEIKLGGNVGWAAFDWLNLKADAYYSFALQSTEKRPAAFSGATIKNIGPCVEADVDYGYFVGRLDATWYHPKNSDLSTTLGYEFYYKTEDKVNFKVKETSDHFLGRAWSTAAGAAAVPGGAIPGARFAPFNMTLDNKVAQKNTESIAHRMRSEINWRANKYFNVFCGGAWTFAGQNIFRENDMHGGINVRF